MNGRPKREDKRNAKTVATTKYNERVYERFTLRVQHGQMDTVKRRASENGQTVNEYINGLISADIDDFQPIGTNPYIIKR